MPWPVSLVRSATVKTAPSFRTDREPCGFDVCQYAGRCGAAPRRGSPRWPLPRGPAHKSLAGSRRTTACCARGDRVPHDAPRDAPSRYASPVRPLERPDQMAARPCAADRAVTVAQGTATQRRHSQAKTAQPTTPPVLLARRNEVTKHAKHRHEMSKVHRRVVGHPSGV